MIAVPLEVPLRTLAPNRLVWIQRGGLVYPYPAGIVRDIANDLYVSGDEFDPSPYEYQAGAILADHYARGTNRVSMKALASSAWRAGFGSSLQFNVWWESVDESAPPALIGAAAASASREIITFSLFKHRYMIDTPSQSL